ncbi:hypothetical protein BJ170DRAFT_290871 [Xylariales sp. AK1849]|nr:hypothetical protein BJ170DRAFT_290871 [Xylariales sp. AK1849]
MAKTNGVVPSQKIQTILDNNQHVPPAIETLVQDLIREQTEQHPDSQAICSWDGDLTYKELDELSSRLANHLVTKGVAPEVFVPLCFEKSFWTIVSVLAVTKAGGGFVLLDPSLPIARLESIVRQTRAKIALSSMACIETCTSLVDEVLAVDKSTLDKLEPYQTRQTHQTAKPTDAAYIMFTSGSTGTPKGVVVDHSSLSTTATYSGRAMGYGLTARNFQFASYAFDPIITDIFATLVHGGTMCIPSEWERDNAIVGAMRRMQVTHLRLTPSLVKNLVIEDVPSLTTMILGGEVSATPLVQEWAAKLRLVLVYGPAECCVICFSSDTSTHEPLPGEIGRPFSARGWVVKQDNVNELAEVGEVGELLVEGATVARGYFNDTAKTEQAFIKDPPPWLLASSGTPMQYRMYRTGDLVKCLDDGTFVYVGRADNQVKIRGQRLELEEVERNLRDLSYKLDGVEFKQVLVEAVPFPSMASKHLVAFLCLNTEEPIGRLDWEKSSASSVITSPPEQERLAALVSKIEEALKQTLPAYAVPSTWVPLREIPLSLSRKVDRKRLRDYAAAMSIKQLSVFTNPNTSLTNDGQHKNLTENETNLRQLWADVFSSDTSSIEVEDNFISLGGDSVLAIRLVAAARAAGLDLSLQLIFQCPVLRDMAQATGNLETVEEHSTKIPPFALLGGPNAVSLIRQEASNQFGVPEELIEDIYPCSPMQQGLIASSIKDPGTYILQQVYQLPHDVDLERLECAWRAVAKRVQIMRTRFFDYHSELYQAVVSESVKWRLATGDLGSLLATEKKQRVDPEETMSKLVVLPQNDLSTPYLVWTIHHALLDGWAEADITSMVEQEYEGQPADATATPPFNRFIHFIEAQDHASSEQYWRESLLGTAPPDFPPLPESNYIPKVERSNRIVDHFASHADAEIERKLPKLKGGTVTAATMIQAAWCLLLGIYSNTTDVVTGMTLNGRAAPLPGIEMIPGPTVTTIPFRTKYRKDQNLTEFLRGVQNQYLDILPHAQFGLQNIRRLNDDAVAACKFRTLLIVQSANKPQSSRKLLLGKGYSFPVMDFAIVIECEILEKSIDFRATFDHQVVTENQVRRMLQQMEDIVYRISVSTPSTKVSDVLGISEADFSQILKWNAKADSPKSQGSCAHVLVQQQTHKRGDALAVSAWDGKLTYEAFHQMVTRLAAHLRQHYEIRPESYVLICLGKSLWAMVAFVAVLKAGGACVPVDAEASHKRQAAIIHGLGNSSASLILVDEDRANEPRQRAFGLDVVAIGPKMIGHLPDVDFTESHVSPSNTAFVFFNADSSDDINGVSIDHQALCARIRAASSLIGHNDQSKFLQFFPYTYYAGIVDMFSTLVNGGCVCIPRERSQHFDLCRFINEHRITHLSLSPTIACSLSPEQLPTVKVLLTTGEPMTKELLSTWAKNTILVNMYGAAELAGYCIGKAGISSGESSSNIGKGIESSTWIVDPEDPDILTPIGGVGELLLERPEMAHGYIGNASRPKDALTTDLVWFTANDASSRQRFYRTGDLVSYDADGSLLYIGRKDNLARLDDQSVNVLTVEKHLREIMPPASKIVVDVVSQTSGEQMLAAFIVVEKDKTDSEPFSGITLITSDEGTEELRSMMEGADARLHAMLPQHAMPSLYLPIDKIPLSHISRITDREALRQLVSSMATEELSKFRAVQKSTRSDQPPSTSMEKRVAELWKTLLETDQIGVNDNFFELGGGSVLAMRLVSLARSAGLTMTVNGIFKAPTLRQLALTVREKASDSDIAPFALVQNTDLTDLRRQAAVQCGVSEEEVEDLYLCHNFQMFYILGYPEAKKPIDSLPWLFQAQLLFKLPPSLDVERWKAVWTAAVRRHLNLRTRVVNTTHGIFQAVLKEPEPFAWHECNDLDIYLKEDQANWMTFGDRLLRLAIVQPVDGGERFFVMTIQHIIYDAFSRMMLFRDVETAYTTGSFPDATPPKMNRFIRYITETDTTAATDFWTSYLQGATVAPLLKDEGKRGEADLKEELATTDMPKLTGSEITLSTFLEVAAGLATARRLDCPDVIFYSDRSGRNLPVEGIEDLIHCTTLFLPRRVHADKQQKLRDLLNEYETFQRASMPHEHLGWLELREMEHLKGTLQHSLEMNINPYPNELLARGLGLEFESIHDSACDDPFAINVYLLDERVEWAICYDEEFIDRETVQDLLKEITEMFSKVVEYRLSGITVGDLFSS